MRASVQSLLVSLALSDTPLTYRPAKGEGVPLSFHYSQRESYQPKEFHYANLGPKWTYAGLSYVIDDPSHPGENVQRYKAGGGTRKFRKEDFDSATGRFAPDGRDGSVLVRISGELMKYERHLANGGLETYAHNDGKTEFPRRFFLTERRDPAGNRLIIHYDAQNRISFVQDATNQKTVLEYKHTDPLKITAIVDPYGRRARIAYDKLGRLISITDAAGMVSKVSYSGRGTFIDTLTTPYGVTRFASGKGWKDRWIEITDPLGRTARVEARDNAPGIADAEAQAPKVDGLVNKGLARHNTFYWDAATYARHKGDYTKAHILHWRTEGDMAVEELSSVKAPLEGRVWHLYDSGTKRAQAVGIARVLPDGSTQAIHTSRNDKGHPLTEIDPVSRETKLTYAENGIDPIKVQQKTASGFETLAEVTWNPQHRPLTVKDAAGQTTRFTYNAAGQLTSRTNAAGATTRYEYNAAGQLIKVLNAAGRPALAYTYDAQGNPASTTDSEGYTVKQEYDALNRPTKTHYPDGTSVEITWDKLDISRVKDRSGKLAHYRYDAARNLVEAKDPVRTILLGYDKANRLTTLTDGNGNTTRWQRDIQGRITAKYTADDVRTFYAYDSAGRQIMRTDAQKQEQHLAYGKDNKLTRITYRNARIPTPEVALTWDAHYPRISAIKDGTGETRYRYGQAGQPGALRLASIDSPAPNTRLNLRYTSTGHLKGWRLGEAAGEEYAFDVLGRATSNRNTALGQFEYGYLGDTAQLTNAALSGMPIQYGYDYEPNTADRRIKEIRNPQAARSYGYQFTNNLITKLTETAQEQSIAWNFDYDDIDRLQTGKRSDGREYGYTLDKGDNLIHISTPEGTRTYNPSSGNKIEHYPHDPVGNRIADERHTYQWDAENRLVKIGYRNNAQRSTEFKYDGQSRRTAIIETDGIRRTETRYTWCGNAICAARNERDQPIAYYFGEGTYRPQVGKKEFYAHDHLGSVRDVLDEKGQSIARFDYDPYGNLINGQNQTPEFGYAGMHYHAPSGLYLTKYRAYDPQSGRWLSRDPIGELGGINLYAYVGGNPVSFVDLLGLAKICKRKLSGPEIAGYHTTIPTVPMPGFTINLWHTQIFYDDGSPDIGFFGATADKPGGIRQDDGYTISDYDCTGSSDYNDNIMKLAVAKVLSKGGWAASDYDWFKHNCQDFTWKADLEYGKIHSIYFSPP